MGAIKYGSVCSGVEAATVAWHHLGWEPRWFSEIEKFPSAVLAHHYPDTPNHGDMTQFKEWPNDPIDLLVGGTPCQSFSVAGLRKGLDDPRGNLMLTYLAIAERYQPRWLVWENVPGVLSSNRGRDFGTFLGALGQIGYGFAYRVLDAQYFGVAQRRRRVFVVGYLGDWRRAAAVLFERESLSGHPAPSRKSRKEVAQCITTRTGSAYDPTTETLPVTAVCATGDIAHTLKGEGHDGSEDGTGRGVPTIAHTVALRGRDGGATAELGGEVATALRASTGGGDKPHVLAMPLNTQIVTRGGAMGRGTGFGLGSETDPGFTLQAGHSHGVFTAPAVAHTLGTQCSSATEDGTGRGSPLVPSLMAVRRLTPVECERLQGFPDDYTLVPHRNKPAADGPRYKSLGNSMAVPVMRWIGERISKVESYDK
jgi:DNA (cytosine-5)-methyltransferase 1